MSYTRVNFQLSLFGWQKPKTKIPINAERIRQGKAALEARDQKGAVEAMRDVREGLERYLARMK